MFQDISLVFIFGPAMAVASIIWGTLIRRTNKKYIPEINKAVENFKTTTIIFGVLLLILYLALPSTPSLSTFGRPENISEINVDEKLLHLLQQYNMAIVRTTDVLGFFLFLFTWWFLGVSYSVAKAFPDGKKLTFA